MKHSNTVRRPSLANSRINTDRMSDLSIGDTLRKAKMNLFFSRCLIAIVAVLLITAAFVLVYLGYANFIIDFVSDAVG